MPRPVTCILLTLWFSLYFLLLALAYGSKRKPLRMWIMHIACKGLLILCRVRVHVIGSPSTARPLLVVSNHVSYFDIPVLGSIMQCRFVPKQEIAGWPIIGRLCKMMDAVFVERRSSKIHEGKNAIADALAEGDIIALFPEATTGEGKHLLPFKPAFYEVARENPTNIQPVAIAYRRLGGLPIDSSQWPRVAWYGDMTLLPHLWTLLGLGRLDVEVHFLPPISSTEGNRKILAARTQEAIAAALVGNTHSD